MADSRQFERTMQQRREQQGVQDALHGFHAVNSRVMAVNESDERVDAMRRMRRFQQQNAEVRTTNTNGCERLLR